MAKRLHPIWDAASFTSIKGVKLQKRVRCDQLTFRCPKISPTRVSIQQHYYLQFKIHIELFMLGEDNLGSLSAAQLVELANGKNLLNLVA